MMNLTLTVLLAFSTLVSAAPPQVRSGALNDVAIATIACSIPKETDSPSIDLSPGEFEERPTQCVQERLSYKEGDAPWGNGLPPAITISPGLPVFWDKDACSTNSKLLTKMEDDFMKSVSKSRKNKQRFDEQRPTFAVRGGACVTSDFTGYADGMPRYRSFNNGPPAPAAPTGWNDPSSEWDPAPSGWDSPPPSNNGQGWQPPPFPQQGQPYQSQWGQPAPTQWSPPAQPQWGQPAQPQWGQPAQSQWGQPAQSQWGQPPPQSQWQPAQNQPNYPPGDRGWQPYTATVTVSYPSQPQPPSQPPNQWQPDPLDGGF